MSYKELFSAIECNRIVIIEDDFKQGEYKKERALYDITRMAVDDRCRYLAEIESISQPLHEVLSKFLSLFDECFDEIGVWDDSIPYGDISCAFGLVESVNPELKVLLEEQYSRFEGEAVQKIYELGAKYGIGVNHPAYFDDLYNNYILSENRAQSLRIYTDFSADTQSLFSDDIGQAAPEHAVVCIIDNYLSGSNRAKEVIQVISDRNTGMRRNIIGSIFSSKEMYEEITDALYFEYVSKEHPEQLKSCIAKSAYNYFISELKSETLLGMGDAFDKAIKNKGIAFFLAQKARTEGASEYEIINDWIRLLSTAPRKDADTIKRMIRLSRVINSLEDDEDLPDADLQQLNTLEAFDYTVNDYFLPVTAGDIFTNSKDEWFVLIGQDCDMARSITRTPKNALAELLPAKVRPQTDFEKWTNDLRSASIYSFRKNLDAGCEVLQVEYQKREYIANEILNLCSFNSTGECKISLSDSIGQEQLMLMPDYMVEYYSKLQQFFLATKTLRIQAEDAFEIVLSKEHSPRLLSFKDFDKTSDTVSFDLKRVCRLTHDYVFYLYKLYLEYRGRQPFQTINLIRQEDTSLPIMYNKEKTGQYLSFRSIPIPDKSNRKNWCWVIDAAELNRVLIIMDRLSQDNGYIVRKATSYDRLFAMDRELLFQFLNDTQPEEMEALRKIYKADLEDTLVSFINSEVTKARGSLLDVLKHGIEISNMKLELMYTKPATTFNRELLAKYEKNIFSVMEEVWASDDERADLVIFLNGIAIMSFELKCNAAGQSYQDAIYQYRVDRDPNTRLFRFKAGCLVNFAMDLEQVYMTTKLAGNSTFFLPFNMGNGEGVNAGAGNPTFKDKYSVSYMWEDILKKDTVLDLISKFIFIETKESKDELTGKTKKSENIIFPRYHQLDVIRKLLADVRENGSTQNYLIQHSAGSGKTNSIAWLAHRLTSLHDADNKIIFDNVVIVTDRVVVDRQLQKAIMGMEHKAGLIRVMDDKCNSADLAIALNGNTKIIATTIQKFPYIVDSVAGLKGKRFAVIIDEAHSSTAGKDTRISRLRLHRIIRPPCFLPP